MTDHLARLCFDGSGSAGWYTPHAMRLRLQGATQPTDHMVYLHEVHHAALNDATAWGTSLHVYARLPGASEQFERLLDACRTTHESLATYASVQIASARHGTITMDEALSPYPQYVPLYQETARLSAGVRGANRKQLAVTALARLCMQTPVLDIVAASGAGAFRLADVPDLDRPDSRWRWFRRRGPAVLADAATVADRAMLARFGPSALDSDGPDNDLYDSTDRDHDAAWAVWEETAYEHLRSLLAATKARTMGYDDHQAGTAALLAGIVEEHGDIGLRAAMTEAQSVDDAAIASSILQQVRHDLTDGDRYRAALLPRADAAMVVDTIAHRPVSDGRPVLILDARPADRLTSLYRWPGDALPDPLRHNGGPVVAVRVFGEDGGTDSIVAHLVVADLDELVELAERWRHRGPVISCVSASCAADAEWARMWLAPLGRLGQVFVLVDIELERFVPAWVRAETVPVNAIGVEVNDSGGRFAALLFTADGGTLWWLAVANDVTIRLVGEYLRAQLGPRLHSDLGPFSLVRDTATVAIAHILATESFISFDAIGMSNAN